MRMRLMSAVCRPGPLGPGWVVMVAAVAGLLLPIVPAKAQTPPVPLRTGDGKPNLNGIWQAMNEANWDIETHTAGAGPFTALGGAFAIPPGLGVVEGGSLPYQPAALMKKKENFANRMKLDPEIKCYLPGVPRAMYLPYPFQIIQSQQHIMMLFEYAGAVRTIYMDNHQDAPADSWMGWSNGHWEGDALVVESTGFVDQTWFDRAGNFHSDALHLVERFTVLTPDALQYDVTIEDPKVFTRPWKMSMPLYRRLEKNAELMEFKCVEFAEEVLYGHLRKQPVK